MCRTQDKMKMWAHSSMTIKVVKYRALPFLQGFSWSVMVGFIGYTVLPPLRHSDTFWECADTSRSRARGPVMWINTHPTNCWVPLPPAIVMTLSWRQRYQYPHPTGPSLQPMQMNSPRRIASSMPRHTLTWIGGVREAHPTKLPAILP